MTELEHLIYMNHVCMGLSIFSVCLSSANLIYKIYLIWKRNQNAMYNQEEDIED